MAGSLVCLQDVKGLGTACEADNPFAVAQSLFLAAEDQEFASAAEFASIDKWNEAVIAKQIFPIHDINNVTDASEEDVTYTSPSTGAKSHIRDGKRGSMYDLQMPLVLHQILRTYSFKKFRLYVADLNGNIIGTSPDGVKVTGISLQYFKVGRMLAATADTPAFTQVETQEADVREFDDRGVYITPTWSPSSIEGVLGLTLAQVGTASGTDIVVDTYFANGLSSDGSVNQIPYTGLEDNSSWVLVDASLAIAAVVESSTVAGRYTITADGAVTGGTIAVQPNTGFPVEADAITYS